MEKTWKRPEIKRLGKIADVAGNGVTNNQGNSGNSASFS